jgi:small conductance mechanosensitive channel
MDERLIATGLLVLGGLVVYLIAVWAGSRFVRRLEAKGARSGARAATLWIVIRRVVLVVDLVLVVLFGLLIWGVSLTPFLAVGTVVGAAIGFGAQDLVRDILAGFFILAEDQYHIGDTVTIADTTGSVEDIQFRVTVLRDFEGNVHYVPNGQITVTSNFTSVYSQPVVDVGIAYTENVDEAMAVMIDELKKLAADPEWAPKFNSEPEMMGVDRFAESAVILRARLTTTAEDRWAVRREALRRIKNRFDAEGIVIPIPQLSIHQPTGASGGLAPDDVE